MDARATTADMLAGLASFDIASRNTNLPLIAYARDCLDGVDRVPI